MRLVLLFWDSYNAMGGESSIIKWAEKIPPLRRKTMFTLPIRGLILFQRFLQMQCFIIEEADSVSYTQVSQAQDSIIPEQSDISITTVEPIRKEKLSQVTYLLTFQI